MKRISNILLFLMILAFISEFLISNEPDWEEGYDSSVISKDDVLDIAEQFFVHQLIKGIEMYGKKPEAYYLLLFNGELDSSFFRRLTHPDLPRLKRGNTRKMRGKFAEINIIKFKHDGQNKLTVIFTTHFRNKLSSEFNVAFEKKEGRWRYIHRP